MKKTKLSKQAQNNIDLCKGQPFNNIVMIWKMGRINPNIIKELAEYYGVSNDMNTVARALSNDR